MQSKKVSNGDMQSVNTLDYYNMNASDFIGRTIFSDMKEIYEIYLAYIPEGGTILDAGCGSGRDAVAFKNMGYDVYAMDGSEEMVKHCKGSLGDRITMSSFQEYEAPVLLDGIWANASFLHIPMDEIAGIIRKFASWLKPEGVFFMSFKYGEMEAVREGRYFNYYTAESLRALIEEVGNLREVRLDVNEDVKVDHEGEKWVSVIGKRC